MAAYSDGLPLGDLCSQDFQHVEPVAGQWDAGKKVKTWLPVGAVIIGPGGKFTYGRYTGPGDKATAPVQTFEVPITDLYAINGKTPDSTYVGEKGSYPFPHRPLAEDEEIVSDPANFGQLKVQKKQPVPVDPDALAAETNKLVKEIHKFLMGQ